MKGTIMAVEESETLVNIVYIVAVAIFVIACPLIVFLMSPVPRNKK